jgi:hypothetical protein
MKYHITIKNNETGELLENADCCCVIGAYATETIATEFYVIDGFPIPIVATAYAALKTIERLTAVHPELESLLIAAFKKGGIFED